MVEFPSTQWRGDRALLILDMVESSIHGPDAIPGAQDCIRFIEGELRYFRERDRSVIFLSTLMSGDSPSPFIEELLPRSNDTVIHKPGPDAFFQTELQDILARKKVRRLTMAGIGASSSILITAASAMSRGYSVAVPEPCVVDENPKNAAFALHLIRNVWSPMESQASILPMAGAAAS
jgi:nicotinamidase-related amidase